MFRDMLPRCLISAAILVGLVGEASAGSEKPLLQAWVRDQKSSCGSEKIEFKKGHVTEKDVNGDGLKDFVLDNGYVQCGESASHFCGTGGCDTTIIASVDGGYVKAFEGLVRDVKFKTIKGRPAMVVTSHGFGCGKIGAENCYSTLFWNGRAFAAGR